VWAIAILAMRVRRGVVPWKRVLIYAIVPAVIGLIAGLDQFYMSKANYFEEVATPWSVFRTGVTTQWLISSAVMYLFFALGLAILSALYPDALPMLRRRERRAAWKDAAFAFLGGIGALLLVRTIGAWLAAANPEWIPFSGWDVPDWLAAPAPVLLLLAGGLSRMLLTALLLAFFSYLWNGPMTKPWQRALLVLAAVLMMMPVSSPDANEWIYSVLVCLVRVAFVYVVLRFLAAGRPVLLLALAAGLTIYTVASNGIGTGNGFVVANTWAFVVLAVGALGGWLYGKTEI